MNDDRHSSPETAVTQEDTHPSEDNRNEEKKRLGWKVLYWFLALAPIAFVVYAYIDPLPFMGTREKVQAAVTDAGSLGALMFVAIQAVQVVVAPINHYVVGLAGGFLFGTWQGFLLNWLGRAIGTVIAFFLARTLGRPLLKRLVQEKTVARFDWLFAHPSSALLLFIIYFLPGFPDDEIAYIAGASRMPAARFLVVSLLGHVGGSLGLAYIGSGVNAKDPLFYIMSLICLILAVLFFIHWRRVQNEQHALGSEGD